MDEYFALSKQLAVEFPLLNVHVVPLLFPTSGPIETLFVMLRAMDEASLLRKTISLDSATLYFSDVLGAFRQVMKNYGIGTLTERRLTLPGLQWVFHSFLSGGSSFLTCSPFFRY